MNVPKLRFKEFSDEWKRYKLQDLCNIYLGVTYTPTYVKTGKIFISSKDISKGYLDLSESKYISLEEYNKISSNAKPKKGDVLFTRVGSNLGNPTVIETNVDLTIFVSLGYLRVNKLFNNYFSKYWMQSNYFWRQVESKVAGGAKQNLNTGWISKFDINVPTICEQEKISKTLQFLDKKIELQSKKIEDFKLFKKGLNKNIFSNLNNKFKIGDLIIEYNKKTSTNNQYKVLSSTSNGIILQNEYFNKQASSSDNSGYKIVPRGFITYRSMSDTGEFHFNIQNIIEIGIVSPAYPVFTINENIVDKDYFVYYINENKSFKNKILSSKEGGTRYALSISKFRDIKLDLPSLKHQKEYSKLLMAYNQKIKQEQNKLDKLHELKKGLMQNMFV